MGEFEKYYTVPEVAEITRRSSGTIHNAVGKGRLVPISRGRGKKLLFTAEAVRAYMRGDHQPPTAAGRDNPIQAIAASG